LENKSDLFFSVTAQKGLNALPNTLICGSYTSEDYGGIEICFSNCTQQCLSREPLLAVALSTIKMEPKDFKKAISTVGALDGEIYQHVFFAAVQLASHKVTPKKTDQGTHETTLECFNIIEFVKELEPYICKSKKNSNLDERNLRALRLDPTFHTSLNIGRKQLVWLDKQLHAPLDESMGFTLRECKIPWLVPACNKDFLSTIEKRLFPDGMIAGLIPSKMNKRFDAFSYALGCSEVVNWAFEFKARSKDYNLTKAIKDLEKKCEEIEVRSCHAMLIAYCETSKSAASAWVDAVSIRTPKLTQKSKLESKLKLVRVAIVFGDA